MRAGRAGGAVAVALVGVTIVHLLAQAVLAVGGDDAAAGWSVLADLTQVLLMPLVAALVLTRTAAPRGRLVRLVLLALFFSWLGDTLPRLASDDTGFLLMVGGFLLAQATYCVAFWPWRRVSVVTRPVLLAPYVMALVVLVVLCAPGAGALLAPVIVYGAALVAMAVLATGLGPRAAWGGAIFLVSDALIAIRAFADLELPLHSVAVMATYVIGQVLLATAAADASREQRAGVTAVSRTPV